METVSGNEWWFVETPLKGPLSIWETSEKYNVYWVTSQARAQVKFKSRVKFQSTSIFPFFLLLIFLFCLALF